MDNLVIDQTNSAMKHVIADMRAAGYLVDAKHLLKLAQRLEPKKAKVLARIRELAGADFDPDSETQTEELLYDRLKLRVYRLVPGTTRRATDDITLGRLSNRVIRPLLRYRELSHLMSVCRELASRVDQHARLLIEYHQPDASTGRTIPESVIATLPPYDEFGMRKAFKAAEGHFIVRVDYRQLEVRVLAALSGDLGLLEAIREGIDLHGLAAAKIYELDCDANEVAQRFGNERAWIKDIQLGVCKGQSISEIAGQIRATYNQAYDDVYDYYEHFPRVLTFRNGVFARVQRDGYVEDLFGQRCFLPDALLKPPQPVGNRLDQELLALHSRVRLALFQAMRFIIQAPVAVFLKLAMIRCHRHLLDHCPGAQLVLALHGGLHFEVPQNRVAEFVGAVPSLVCDLGVERFNPIVPLDIEIQVGPSWGRLEKWTRMDSPVSTGPL